MKKILLKSIILAIILTLSGGRAVNAEKIQGMESLEQIQKIANIEEKPIPSDLSELEVWKNETKHLMESKYELPVVKIIDTPTSVTFVFEEVLPENAEEGVSYPTVIEYNKVSNQSNSNIVNALPNNQTKYVSAITYSGLFLKKKNSFLANVNRGVIDSILATSIGILVTNGVISKLAEVIVSAIVDSIKSGMPNNSSVTADVYTQTKKTNRSGQVGIVAWNGAVAWKPTYIIEKYDYYAFTQGRIYYTNMPAIGYSTDTELYDTFTNTYFYSSAALYQSRALSYYAKGETYINGKIYKM